MEEEFNILGSLKTLQNKNPTSKSVQHQSVNVDSILEEDLGNLAQLLFPKAKDKTKVKKMVKEKVPPAAKEIESATEPLLEQTAVEPPSRVTRAKSKKTAPVTRRKRQTRKDTQASEVPAETAETATAVPNMANEVVPNQDANQNIVNLSEVVPVVRRSRRVTRSSLRGQPADAPANGGRTVSLSLINNRAASLPVVDVVDLVSSPLPPLNGMVVIVDSDIEEDLVVEQQTSKTNKMDIDLSDDNPELSIKIKWNGNPEVFKLRKYQKFIEIHKKLAERENMNINQIVLILNNKIVTPDDTPAGINYKIYQFISGRVLSNCSTDHSLPTQKIDKKTNVMLKVQSEAYKHPMGLSLGKSDKFKVLYIKCAEELGLSPNQLVLKFNGEVIDYEETPDELEFEGDEVIDLIIKK